MTWKRVLEDIASICIYFVAPVLLLATIIIGIYMINRPVDKQLEVRDARYVLYTSEDGPIAVDGDVIIDMQNGYQYIVFNIDGQYVVSPRIADDGTVYKTVE